jgi:hypothetical protein
MLEVDRQLMMKNRVQDAMCPRGHVQKGNEGATAKEKKELPGPTMKYKGHKGVGGPGTLKKEASAPSKKY